MIRSVIDRDLWTSVSTGNITSDTYDSALGFNLIRMRPNPLLFNTASVDPTRLEEIDRILTGVMTNEFSYSMDSEWSSIQTPFDSGIGNILGGIATAAGGGELGSVFRSKKYWKKSGYITLDPQIRIIDINGDGLPLRAARLLLQWTVADRISNESTYEAVLGVRSFVAKTVNKGIDIAKKTVDAIPTPTDKEKQEVARRMKASLNEGINIARSAANNVVEDAADLLALRQAPPPLIVEIGKMFKHDDMVITNVSFNFSREFTENGPLYIDATLNLSTRKIVSTVDDIGLYNSVGGNSRVSIAGESTGGAIQQSLTERGF